MVTIGTIHSNLPVTAGSYDGGVPPRQRIRRAGVTANWTLRRKEVNSVHAFFDSILKVTHLGQARTVFLKEIPNNCTISMA